MMNDTTKEYNRKNTYKNNVVCNTWRLGGSGIGNFKFYEGEIGGKQKRYFLGVYPIREVFLRER